MVSEGEVVGVREGLIFWMYRKGEHDGGLERLVWTFEMSIG